MMKKQVTIQSKSTKIDWNCFRFHPNIPAVFHHGLTSSQGLTATGKGFSQVVRPEIPPHRPPLTCSMVFSTLPPPKRSLNQILEKGPKKRSKISAATATLFRLSPARRHWPNWAKLTAAAVVRAAQPETRATPLAATGAGAANNPQIPRSDLQSSVFFPFDTFFSRS